MTTKTLTHEVQWRRTAQEYEEGTVPAGPWRTDALNPYHESQAAAESYVRTVAMGGVEFRIVKRDA